MKNKFLCWLGIHKINDNDWEDIWEEDGYSGEICVGEKNFCVRCGKIITRK